MIRQQQQQAEQRQQKADMWGSSTPITRTHLHTLIRIIAHTGQIRPCNVHARIVVVHTKLVCNCCFLPRLPQSRELLQQWSKTADMWVFHCLARLYLREKQHRDHLPDFAALNAQSTHDGARPGPKLAPWCTGGPPACPVAESPRKNPLARRKACKCFFFF